MRFYNNQHRFYCGIDLHARLLAVCVLGRTRLMTIIINITLPPDSERYLRDQFPSGKFSSADDVISEALRRMREYAQKVDGLSRDIAIEQANQGVATKSNFARKSSKATLVRVKSKARQK